MQYGKKFFTRDVLCVAPELVGKLLVRTMPDGTELKLRITETEAYRGEEDLACHASKGRTKRTEPLYQSGGVIYVYLCYGIHWLFNIVTERADVPQAVLIRACEGFDGPAKLTKKLLIDKSFNGQSIIGNPLLRIEDDGFRPEIRTAQRVGINYAGKEWLEKPWRFISCVPE